jgi:hypothetical protein
MWFDKNHPEATFVDVRESVSPTVCCDSRELPSQIGSGFDLIVFDPPHVNFGANAEMSKTYGHHTTEQIRDIIRRTAQETHRVAAPRALMAFKWNDHDQKLERVLALMSEWWEPLFGNIVSQRTKHSCMTYWVMLRRKDVDAFIPSPKPIEKQEAML